MADQTLAARPEPSPGARLAWGLLSTLILAALISITNRSWVFGLAGVVGVFVHEYGHVLAINALGFGPGRITIVPFMGGAATPRIPPSTEFRGVLIALAGPTFGLLAMIPFFFVYAYTYDRAWLGGAFFIALINLVNLAPAPPLDGSKAVGPALAAIHPWVEKGALVLVGGAAVLWAVSTHNFLFGALLAIGVLGALRRGALRPYARKLTAPEWLGSLALYAAALVLCTLAFYLSLDGRLAFAFAPVASLFGR